MGFEKARLELRDHPAVGQKARHDSDGVAQEGLHQHALEVARGEDREHEEGGAHGNTEAREAENEERGDDVDPIDTPRRLGKLCKAAVGDVAVIGHPAPDQHGDQHGDRPGPKNPPGPMRIRRNEGAQGLYRIVGHDGVGGQNEAHEHEQFRNGHNSSLPLDSGALRTPRKGRLSVPVPQIRAAV